MEDIQVKLAKLEELTKKLNHDIQEMRLWFAMAEEVMAKHRRSK